jgi:PKD repeat protein
MLMKRMKLIFTILTIVTLGVLTIVSCKKEEEAPKPVPDFTYEINDKTVTFTNTSTDATTYSWDFDDGTTSTEENPVHVYTSYGDYDVRLTATGEGGEETKRQTISVVKVWPTITIDGDFGDWAAVETFYGGYGDASGTLTEAKVTSDAAYSKLYFYVKGTLNSDFPVIQIMINADADTVTGWSGIYSGYASDGADYQFEYGFDWEWCATYAYGAEVDQGWPWEDEITADEENGDITETSGVIGGTEIEFVIETSLMVNPPMSTTQIGIYFWAQPEDWSETSGFLPPIYAEPLEDVKIFSFQ